MNRPDLGMTCPMLSRAAGHPAQHTASVQAEPGFPRAELTGLGHLFANNPEIGAASGIEFDSGLLQAVAAPQRCGGVVIPD
jgi:gamma-glutamyltranspeptidase/glutathione hydrolase